MNQRFRAGVLPLKLFAALLSQAQPELEWQHALGGTESDHAFAIEQTTDGGYIMAGYTVSNNGDVSGNHGLDDAWVVKLDASGTTQWQKALGGTGPDWARAIQQTTDGGYIVSGYTWSNDGDASGNHGAKDAWVLKLDGLGNMQWQKTLGGTDEDEAYAIEQTIDGGYIMFAETYSNDGDVSGNHGGVDAWAVKLDEFGNVQWQKALGGTSAERARAIKQTVDGGYIMLALTYSNDGDVSGNHGTWDAWVVKLDASGTIQWQKALGGTDQDFGNAIQRMADGGYILAGGTESNDGDVFANHGGRDAWVVKLDGLGNMQWQQALGGTGDEEAYAIQQTVDGGCILAGEADSNDGDVSGNHGLEDAWVVKLDNLGDFQWQKALGGTSIEHMNAIQQTTDEGFVMAGSTLSNNGDVSGYHAGQDAWTVKLGSIVTGDGQLSNPSLALCPNPTTGRIHLAWNGAQGLYSVSILDATGRVLEVDHAIDTSCTLDLGSRKKGAYLLKVVYPDGTTIIRRVVKE